MELWMKIYWHFFFRTRCITLSCSMILTFIVLLVFTLFVKLCVCACYLLTHSSLTLCRYSKMRGSVTNSYIVNLAVSDFCFLVGLPFVIITAVRRQWIFGYICCKLFYILTALNWFTSVSLELHFYVQ